jgi:dinuclear metal center YbgI/SA1388 family protein
MTVGDVQRVIESWAPRHIALERDNNGLQCGNPRAPVRGILVALDPAEAVVAEARRKKANLVVTHHPLLFRPLQSVTSLTPGGRCLRALVTHDIAMLAAHTSLDFTRGGTSSTLAETLGLINTEFLHRPYRVAKKIVTYLPRTDVDRVADAMVEAGAGTIGKYDHCSFRVEGTGTFRGNEATSPRVGTKGVLERVQEVRLEMVVHSWDVDRVVAALLKAHPYEEVAYEIYPTENRSTEYGMGVVGDLPHPRRLRDLLNDVKKALNARGLRYAGEAGRLVRRVVVCGGSGADLIDEAIRSGAEVFITADVKYHGFQQAASRIAVVDAGHYETEFPVVHTIVDHLRRAVRNRGERIPVHATRISTNPVRFF